MTFNKRGIFKVEMSLKRKLQFKIHESANLCYMESFALRMFCTYHPFSVK